MKQNAGVLQIRSLAKDDAAPSGALTLDTPSSDTVILPALRPNAACRRRRLHLGRGHARSDRADRHAVYGGEHLCVASEIGIFENLAGTPATTSLAKASTPRNTLRISAKRGSASAYWNATRVTITTAPRRRFSAKYPQTGE